MELSTFKFYRHRRSAGCATISKPCLVNLEKVDQFLDVEIWQFRNSRDVVRKVTPAWARKPADTAGNVPFPYAFSTNDSLQFLVSRAGSFSGTRTLSENCHPFFLMRYVGGYMLCSPLRLFCQRCLGPPLLQWQAHTSLGVTVTDIPTVCPSLPPLLLPLRVFGNGVDLASALGSSARRPY